MILRGDEMKKTYITWSNQCWTWSTWWLREKNEHDAYGDTFRYILGSCHDGGGGSTKDCKAWGKLKGEKWKKTWLGNAKAMIEHTRESSRLQAIDPVVPYPVMNSKTHHSVGWVAACLVYILHNEFSF
jgi:hypothetical protein